MIPSQNYKTGPFKATISKNLMPTKGNSTHNFTLVTFSNIRKLEAFTCFDFM